MVTIVGRLEPVSPISSARYRGNPHSPEDHIHKQVDNNTTTTQMVNWGCFGQPWNQE